MNKPANAPTLGYAAFALTLWMASMIHAGWFAILGGDLGLVTALTGMHTAFAEVINESRGHRVLPTGEHHDTREPILHGRTTSGRRMPQFGTRRLLCPSVDRDRFYTQPADNRQVISAIPVSVTRDRRRSG